MIYCDLGALSPYELSRTFYNIKLSLKEDGYFFFDVLNENYYDSIKEESITYKETNGFFIKGDATITKTVTKYPKDKLIVTHYFIDGSKKFHIYNYDKCYNHQEMSNLLNQQHFEIVDVYSDTTGNKLFNTFTLTYLTRKKI